jgi:hypothetical protein
VRNPKQGGPQDTGGRGLKKRGVQSIARERPLRRVILRSDTIGVDHAGTGVIVLFHRLDAAVPALINACARPQAPSTLWARPFVYTSCSPRCSCRPRSSANDWFQDSRRSKQSGWCRSARGSIDTPAPQAQRAHQRNSGPRVCVHRCAPEDFIAIDDATDQMPCRPAEAHAGLE